MSAQATARAAAAHPLKNISFSDPAVAVERRSDGTIYLRPKAPLGDYPVRLTDSSASLGKGDAGPRLHGRAWRGRRLAQAHLR